MCGICGITGKVNREIIESMTRSMIHRGPDSAGFYIQDEVSLGMRRLKIIDLNTGDQPIHNEDKTIWVIFNGEIYNFRALRDDLTAKGHRFYTQSDTEVIVHLYEEYKDDCVKELRGMFAFCIWDDKEQRLLLARDRLGIKPLYYTLQDGQFTFASELNALLRNPRVKAGINFTALDSYLTFLYIPAPLTIYENINKLLPGHTLSFQNGEIKIRRYWQLRSPAREGREGREYYTEKIREMLEEVVRLHLVSDVPIGALLSGGLDSSCLVGLMSKLVDQPIKTFSFGFTRKYASYNELEYSRQVAGLFNCDHHEFILKPDIESVIPEMVDFLDEPFADSSAILNFLICKEARQFVTVALSGIGGDEAFGGYPRYLGAMSAQSYQKIPYFLRAALKNLAYILPESSQSTNPTGRLKRYLSSGTLPLEEKYIHWMTYFGQKEKDSLYKDGIKDIPEREERFIHYEYFSGLTGDFADRANFVDIQTYLPDDLLVMADRMSMANSLELRVPLCDHKLMELLFCLPLSLKLKGFRLKALFRESLKDLLPRQILDKRKQGFMVPLADWLKEDLRDFVSEVLSQENIRKRGLFNPRKVKSLLDGHFAGRRINTHKIWALFILELWLDRSKVK